jgi:hypothetical protein
MEVNRKLNAFGAIIGAVGIFGFIISAILLMNSIQYLRGITDDGCVTIPAQTAFQFADTYYYLYRSEDANYLVEVPVTQEEYDGFVLEDTDPIERRVYEDANGTYYYFEDLDAKPMAVLEEVGMPFKLPIWQSEASSGASTELLRRERIWVN